LGGVNLASDHRNQTEKSAIAIPSLARRLIRQSLICDKSNGPFHQDRDFQPRSQQNPQPLRCATRSITVP
jgi:hypothetical protein